MKRWHRISLIAVGLLLTVALISPLLIPIPPLEDTLPPGQLADPDSQFIQVNSLSVHYKTLGAGESTLLLLHGFAASTFSWRQVMAPLSEMGRVVAFDRPAFGLTERPLPAPWPGDWESERANPYTTAGQVALTVGLMDELGIERAILVGNSAGGAVAMQTALNHPERVETLILVDPAVYAQGSRAAWIRFLSNTPHMRRVGPLIVRRIQDWGVDFARSAWHDPSQITPEIWEGYLKPLRAQNWDRALWELTRSARPSDLPERLDELTMDCLIVTGDDDRIVPTDQSIRLASELPNAELVVIPSCGHVPHEECPDQFLRAVTEFLKGRAE
ncbi:MAG TPA: alpha/beta hydrolase [Chloroflexi bacterium]|nr:alpha/beta hydrolase [Chloroflexota bacterium]